MRGIVVAPPEVSIPDSLDFEDAESQFNAAQIDSRMIPWPSSFDTQTLRGWTLLFDKIATAWSTGDQLHPDADFQFLEAAGVLVNRNPNEFWQNRHRRPDGVGQHHEQKFLWEELSYNEPGIWSLGEYGFLESKVFSPDRADTGLYIDLVKLVPVPSGETPLEDVLSFRMRRQSELLALHHAIAGLYQEVIAAPDRSLAETVAREKLLLAVQDQVKVSLESPLSFRWADLSINFNLYAAGIAFAASIPTGFATAAGIAVGAGFAVKIGPSIELVGSTERSPFNYVSRYHRELLAPSRD